MNRDGEGREAGSAGLGGELAWDRANTVRRLCSRDGPHVSDSSSSPTLTFVPSLVSINVNFAPTQNLASSTTPYQRIHDFLRPSLRPIPTHLDSLFPSPAHPLPTPETSGEHKYDYSPLATMAVQPSTPGRESARSAAVPSTPATSRVAGTHIIQSSPHYTTTRRHALYGTEDRIVIDPGSRIWKVGFSGEGKPRDVFYADGATGDALWGLDRATDPVQRAEEDTILQVKFEARLRSVFHE